MTVPELTVVLMVDRRRERAARVLQSVLGQSAIDRLCVLLFDFGHHACLPVTGSDHPAVTIIPLPRHSSLGAVRLEAFQRAETPLVAFVEEHAIVVPRWAEALLRRFEDGRWAGVGGEVSNLRPGSIAGDALYWMNFTRFSAPASGGPSSFLPGNNSAYRRDAVLSLGDELVDLLEIEPLLNWRLAERGHRLVVDPAVRIVHANETSLMSFIEANFVFSRLFGALRGDVQGWSTGQRLARVLLAPALPFIRTARLLRFMAFNRPFALAQVVRGLPAILLSQVASVTGQTFGILFGEGRSRHEFLVLTLDAPREESPSGVSLSGGSK